MIKLAVASIIGAAIVAASAMHRYDVIALNVGPNFVVVDGLTGEHWICIGTQPCRRGSWEHETNSKK